MQGDDAQAKAETGDGSGLDSGVVNFSGHKRKLVSTLSFSYEHAQQQKQQHQAATPITHCKLLFTAHEFSFKAH